MNLYKTNFDFFNTIVLLVYVLLFFTMIGVSGISNDAQYYLNIVQFVMQIYVGLLLVIRFHPFKTEKVNFSELDRKVAYTAGIFVLSTTSLANYLKAFVLNTDTKTVPGAISG